MLKTPSTTRIPSPPRPPSRTEHVSSVAPSFSRERPPPVSETAKVLGFFGRLTWMLYGPLALAIVLILVTTRGGGWMTAYDLTFFGILGIMLLGRFLEFRGGNPQTAEGQPATKDHLRRYVIATTVLAVLIWGMANGLGNHWLTR